MIVFIKLFLNKFLNEKYSQVKFNSRKFNFLLTKKLYQLFFKTSSARQLIINKPWLKESRIKQSGDEIRSLSGIKIGGLTILFGTDILYNLFEAGAIIISSA